ncbi:MAG: hypothetical protein QG656_1198 [Candidatus Hydrogenedentes bacterium]|nr:hypothetical protein [Candidatus Hydrogenedentota bacterium]
MSDNGYVNYFEILELDESAKPGDVRKNYKRKMKDLVLEIARVEITEERRDRYLLDMAKLNAAFCVLRDNGTRERYWLERGAVMALEEEWRAAALDPEKADPLRRRFDGMLRDFLTRYLEETMLEAGRDKECVEMSNWDAAHERHAFRILRQYRQSLHRQILERLPYFDVTPPRIDWDERRQTVAAILAAEGRM